MLTGLLRSCLILLVLRKDRRDLQHHHPTGVPGGASPLSYARILLEVFASFGFRHGGGGVKAMNTKQVKARCYSALCLAFWANQPSKPADLLLSVQRARYKASSFPQNPQDLFLHFHILDSRSSIFFLHGRRTKPTGRFMFEL